MPTVETIEVIETMSRTFTSKVTQAAGEPDPSKMKDVLQSARSVGDDMQRLAIFGSGAFAAADLAARILGAMTGTTNMASAIPGLPTGLPAGDLHAARVAAVRRQFAIDYKRLTQIS